jgi:hypothetical protein
MFHSKTYIQWFWYDAFLLFLHMLYIQAVLKHYWHAKTAYKIHSPFLSSFIVNVLEDNKPLYSSDTLKNPAQSSGYSLNEHTLRSHPLKLYTLKFLFRFSKWYQADETTEIGAASPINNLYLSGRKPDSKLAQTSQKKRHLFVVHHSEMSTVLCESFMKSLQEKSEDEYALIITGIYNNKTTNILWKKLCSCITGSFFIETNNMGLIIQQNQPFPIHVHLIHRKYKPYQLY